MSTKKGAKRPTSASGQETGAATGSAAGAGLSEAEQLREAQEAMQLLQERIHALQLQSQQQGQQQAASSRQTPEAQVREGAPRRQLVQPQQLHYETAAQGTTLADWLFDLDRLFRQLNIDEAAAAQRISEASLHWDRQIDIWWQGRKRQARTAGTPIDTWAVFVAALQANFVPTGDAEAAARELLRLRMKGGEAMDTYMQRAALLLARCDGRIDAATAARIAVEGVDSSRFPFSLAAVRATMRGNANMEFHQVRLDLTEAAVHEPRLATVPASSGGSSNSSGRSSAAASGHGASKSSKQLRISALERQLEQLRAGEGSDDESGSAAALHTAPVARQQGAGRGGPSGGSSGSRPLVCNKCGAAGHVVAECHSKKEQRKCFVCGLPGHIAMRCEKRKGGEGPDGGGEGSGPEGGAKSKNE